MNPSVEQLQRWAKDDGDGWIRIPASAWHSVLWLLETLERVENEAPRWLLRQVGLVTTSKAGPEERGES